MSRKRLACLAVTLIVAGCGGASPSALPTGTTTAPASGTASEPPGDLPAASADPEPGSTAGGEVAAACELLTTEDIVEVTGWKVAEVRAEMTHGLFENGCRWTLDGGPAMAMGVPARIVLGVLSPGGRDYFDRYFAPFAAENGDEPLEGLADVGLRQSTGSVMAVLGDVLVAVQWLDGTASQSDKPVDIVRRVLENVAGEG
ncbi:MAG: hypothetical protein A2V85_16980 [Chloroflexi bacterium RBG_16_72_14]|nr:MAG: hypothetical protein A2V85_16980 [Chloroflexi bacterium RBG_16_72_14]